MKKFSRLAYVFVVSMLVLSLSGCGGSSKHKSSSNSNSNGGANATATKLMTITSTAFVQGESYDIYRGKEVDVLLAKSNEIVGQKGSETNCRYYISADRSASPVSLQLEFAGTASNDVPFAIALNGSKNVIFYFNPNGDDLGNPYISAELLSGSQKKQSYSGLALSSLSTSGIVPAVINIDSSDEIVIVLNSSDNSATVNGTKITANDYVWHISPDYPTEYWTLGSDAGGEKLTKKEAKKAIKESENLSEGVYIARDVCYVPSSLSFSSSNTATKADGTAEGDNDKLYVAYYNKNESVDQANKYIIAALPTGENAMGGGEPNQGQQGFDPMNRPQLRPSASNFDSIVKKMTHSASDAYKNPVLHITEPGVYRLKGSWNGQIWIDADDEVSTDQVALILDTVSVRCTVAPALVFKKVYECGPDDADTVASGYKTVNEDLFDSDNVYAGAVVVIANGSTNTFTGTNVARINEAVVNTDDGYTTSDVGTYVKAQEKLYKLDGAFHSRRSMVIGLEDGATSGTLNINSDYEGLDSEMHLLINSGTINVTANDDGINVNEDETSVFYMEGGTVTVKSANEDGIDSNGYLVVTGGKLQVSAGSQATGNMGGIDADNYISVAANTYYWAKAGSTAYTPQNAINSTGGQSQPGQTPEEENVDYDLDEEETIDDDNVVTYQAKALELAAGDLTDEQRVQQGVKKSDEVFKLVNKVNNFSEVK